MTKDLETMLDEMAEEALDENDVKNEETENSIKESSSIKKKKKKIEEILEEDENDEDDEYEEEDDDIEDKIVNKQNSPKVHRGRDGYVSETFDNLVKDLETKEEIEKESPKNILNNIKVDLNSIEIIDDNSMGALELSNLEDTLLNDKTTMLVTCCQSSYTAEMSALRSQEIQAISNSDVDYYSYKKKLFQTIHNHIETTSVGKMTYAKWIGVTSFFDIETLLYGMYCQTFQYNNKYSINCPSCRKQFDAVVNNNTLVEIRGEKEGAELYAKINEIVSSVKNADELIEKSQVHKTKRICLGESKIIFDIKIPSALNYLEDVVSKTDNKALEDYQNAIGLTLFIDSIYLPNILLYRQTGELKYVKLNANNAKMIQIVSELSYYDSLQLTDEINSFVDMYRVTYSIRDVVCPHCSHKIPNIPLDMEEMLFLTIRQGRQ